MFPLNGNLLDGSSGTYSGPSRIIDPATGNPFARSVPPGSQYDDGFALPHVISFQAILAGAWRQYWPHMYDEAYRTPTKDFHLVMWRQLHLQTILVERLRALRQLRWQITVEDEKDPWQLAVKNGLTQLVKSTPRFKDLWRSLHMAIWPGRSGAQGTWEWATENLPTVQAAPVLPGIPAMGTTPQQGKAPRRCLKLKQHHHVNGDKLLTKYDGTALLEVYSPECPNIPGLLFEPSQDGAFVAEIRGTWKNRFFIHRHWCLDADFFDYQAADAIGGVGIRSVLAWTEWLRQEWLASVCSAAQRFGYGGIKIWYYPAGNNNALQEARQRAKDNTDRVNIMVPVYPDQKTPSIDVVDMQTSGIEVLLRLIEHVEYWQGRFVRGQSVSTSREGERGGIGGGDMADQNTDDQRSVTLEDAESLQETLTGSARDCGLVWMIFSRTWPEMLDKMPCPRFEFKVSEPKPEDVLNACKTFVELGGTLIEGQVRGTLPGFDEPNEGDAVLGGAQPMLPGHPEPEASGEGEPPGLQEKYAFDENQARDKEGKWAEGPGRKGKRKSKDESPIKPKDEAETKYAKSLEAMSRKDKIKLLRQGGFVGVKGDNALFNALILLRRRNLAREESPSPKSELIEHDTSTDPAELPWSGNMSVPADWRSLTSDPGELDETHIRDVSQIHPSEESSRQAIDAMKDYISNPENDLPPIVVERDDEGLYILDGNTRFLAAKELGYKKIPVREHLQDPETPTEYAFDPNQPRDEEGKWTAHVNTAMEELDKETPRSPNFHSLVKLRKKLSHVPRKELDATIQHMRRQGTLRLSAAEGRYGISPEEREAGIREEGQLLLHARRAEKYQEEQPTSYAFDENKHPRGQPENAGEFAPKAGGGKLAEQAAQHVGGKIKAVKVRAFAGKPVETKTKLSKQLAGAIGEQVCIEYLKLKGLKDARPFSGFADSERNNLPADLIQDHRLIECKAGQASNSTAAQQWRLTIGEPGEKEKAWLAKASPEQKVKHNAEKQARIRQRKTEEIKRTGQRLGFKVGIQTMTIIINPDTRTADVYVFDGVHDRIGWNSEQAKAGYVGSYQYGR